MIRFNIFCFLVIFIVIPQNTHSIFLEPLINILGITGNLTCYLDSTDNSSGYNLCAIRVYTSNKNAASPTVIVWDGMWVTNTFRQFIKTRNCTGFNGTSDIGSGTCDLMPYEIANTMTLCICATDGCNENLETCEESIQTNQNFPLLPTIISSLTTIIECNDTLDNSFTCPSNVETTSLIDVTACITYVNTHSVLCTIIENDLEGTITQQALIEENYQSYLTDRLHELRLTVTLNELNDQTTNIYVNYSSGKATYEECACTENSFCNNNINTCVSNIQQTETTALMEFPSSFFTDLTSESTPVTATMISVSTVVTTSTTVESTIATAFTETEFTIGTASTTAESTIATASTTAESTIATASTTAESTIAAASTTAESTIATDFTETESTIGTASTTAESTIATASTTAESTIVTAPMTAESTIVTASTAAGSTIVTASTAAGSTIVTASTAAGSTIVTASTAVGSTIATTSVNNTAMTESTTAPSTTSVTSSSAANSVSNDTGLSRGAIIGIVVGVVLAAAVIVSAIVFAFVHSGIFQCPTDRTANYRI